MKFLVIINRITRYTTEAESSTDATLEAFRDYPYAQRVEAIRDYKPELVVKVKKCGPLRELLAHHFPDAQLPKE